MIRLTPAARKQLDLLTDLKTVNCGFLIGTIIGRHTVIDNLMPVNFNRDDIDEIYGKTFEKTGEKLLGVFFKENYFFLSDWFEGDIVLQIGENNRFAPYHTFKETK